MTRRESIRLGTLFGVAMALGKLDALHAQGGELTVDLNQWRQVVFTFRGKKIAVSTHDIFESLSAVGVAGIPTEK